MHCIMPRYFTDFFIHDRNILFYGTKSRRHCSKLRYMVNHLCSIFSAEAQFEIFGHESKILRQIFTPSLFGVAQAARQKASYTLPAMSPIMPPIIGLNKL